jgi:hypothetical protein|uniref:Uncharacterized protein n=1 Tax=viral metagenome TaxID=1070528 RepID=A0A6C0J4P3_9ZZZZ
MDIRVVKFVLIEAERGYNPPGTFSLVEEIQLKENQFVEDALNSVIGKNLGQNLNSIYGAENNIFPAKHYEELIDKIEKTNVFNKPYEIIYINENGDLIRHQIQKNAVFEYAKQEYQKCFMEDNEMVMTDFVEKYNFTKKKRIMKKQKDFVKKVFDELYEYFEANDKSDITDWLLNMVNSINYRISNEILFEDYQYFCEEQLKYMVMQEVDEDDDVIDTMVQYIIDAINNNLKD